MGNFEVLHVDSFTCRVKISGDFEKESIKSFYSHIKTLKQKNFSFISIDCSKMSSLDFAGALLIVEFISFFTQKGSSATIIGVDEKFEKILYFARKNLRQKPKPQKKKESVLRTFANKIGKPIVDSFDGFFLFLSFFGESIIQSFRLIITPWQFRYKATLVHIEKSGAQALPIVALTSFLVGLVIAYQGADQLAKFGANIFIVDMVSISVFRELAPLIAAIVIAGRSASSYTAEIGTMKITEEIDALKSMGFDPIIFLVLPRVFALVISMPLIVFFADIVGVFGGMIVAEGSLGISYREFIVRARDVVEMKHILIGLIKAPFFGLLIAMIGCFRGFQVTGSTESIGRYTTISVVNAIFWVIACNALISVLLTEVGI